MRKKRIKRIVFLIIGIIVLFVIIAIVYFQFNPNLEPPIESLQKVDSTLTMEQLKEINRNYREALSEKGVLGQVELYLSDDGSIYRLNWRCDHDRSHDHFRGFLRAYGN